MKRKTAFIISLILTAGCASAPLKQAVIDQSEPYIQVEVSFNPENYPWIMGTAYPTFAVWIEQKESGYLKTIYVTGKAGRNRWIMADERPQAVPVWQGVLEKEKAGNKNLTIDSVTGATPSGESFSINWQVPPELSGKKADIFIEANISFDYNDYYGKDSKKGTPGYNGENGQPSLVWKGTVKLGKTGTEISPQIIGNGNVLGEDNEIHTGMPGITTAKDIFSHIKVRYINSAGDRPD